MNDNYYDTRVTLERVSERVGFLEDAYNYILDDYTNLRPFLSINISILYKIGWSYFFDIERHKHFHDLVHAERTKIAAYTVKWILQLRPISFDDSRNTQPHTQKLLLFNEIYALRLAFSLAELRLDTFIDTTPVRNGSGTIGEKLWRETLYSFRYRPLTAEGLMLWLSHLARENDELETG